MVSDHVLVLANEWGKSTYNAAKAYTDPVSRAPTDYEPNKFRFI